MISWTRSFFLSLLTALSGDRKSTRLNSSHRDISYAVFCLKKITMNPLLGANLAWLRAEQHTHPVPSNACCLCRRSCLCQPSESPGRKWLSILFFFKWCGAHGTLPSFPTHPPPD